MTRHRSLAALWTLFAVQSFCAIFFALDAVLDFLGLEGRTGFRQIDTFEYFVAAALFLGVFFNARELRRVAQRHKRMSDQLRVSAGQFAELLEDYFDEWGLTAAERDVALLSIKGLSIADIAAIRNTREGTVKAQNAAVYRKAGVTGRLQLLSLFIEDLIQPDTKAEADG